MKGLKIGHITNEKHGTGATAFVFDQPAVAAYELCGSSPATVEIRTLDLDAAVTHIDGLVFLGGSAFGLAATSGAMRWFKEQNRGWATPHGPVPIVPAAAIYDLGVESDEAPTADEVYRACQHATEGNVDSGRIGAGTGALVGKLFSSASPMPGGLGVAQIDLPGGVSVIAFAVVNAVGDVLNKNGDIIAGAHLLSGEFIDSTQSLLSCTADPRICNSNTTLVAVFTNAIFSRPELKRIAKMAVAGMGRAISPIFTRYDGDIIFSVSVGALRASELIVGTAAAKATQQAIINAVNKKV